MAEGPPHLLHVFATFAPGGPQVRTVRMMKAFGEEMRHSVVAMDGRTDARELLGPDDPVEVLDGPPRAGTFKTLRAMRELFERVGADLVLTYNWGSIEALLAARSLGIREVVHHEDGFLSDEAGGDFKRRRVLFRRLVLGGVRTLIVPSRKLEGIATAVWRQPAERVRYIPNGIDVDAFPAADGNPSLRAELGIPPEAFVVGAVGHLRGEKNVPRLVRSAVRLPERAHLLIVGDGPERGAVEAAAADPALEGRVHLAGHREELAPWYRAMDAFAISSDTEQMPVALLEAMSAELPVATLDVGDVRDMLPEEQGELVVPPEEADPEAALARALARLEGDAALCRRLGRANRAEVEERFTLEGMLEAYRSRYRHGMAAG